MSKQLIKIGLVLSLGAFLTGCDPFSGILTVKKAFSITSSETDPTCQNGPGGGREGNHGSCDTTVQVQIPVGTHDAKFDFVTRDQVRISMKANGKNQTVNLTLNNKISIPDNGDFSISAGTLGQSFSAQGNQKTTVIESRLYRDYESCRYERWERRCYYEGNQYVCRDEQVTYYGHQEVEFYNKYTHQDLNVSFIGREELAQFKGAREMSEKIYTYKGMCY